MENKAENMQYVLNEQQISLLLKPIMRKTVTNQSTNGNRNTTMKRLPLYSFVHLTIWRLTATIRVVPHS